MFKNTTNANLSYYKGLIRELDNRLNIALARINRLEKQIKKVRQTAPVSDDSVNSMTADQEARLTPNTGVTGFTGGLSEADVRKIVNDAIEQGLVNIPIHDHTADNKGGDCFANLGATLQ